MSYENTVDFIEGVCLKRQKNWGRRKGKNNQNIFAVRFVSAVTNFATSFKKMGKKIQPKHLLHSLGVRERERK